MTILQEYETRVECDDNSCSVRYYIKGEPLSIGLIRLGYTNTKGVNGLIITVTEWNVGELINDIFDNHNKVPTEMLDILRDIKTYAVDKVREHLSKGTS